MAAFKTVVCLSCGCNCVFVRWNYALSGLDPWSYHAVNVLLHAVVSSLFAWLCRNCLGLSKLSSLLAASLFAIHPIHTEAVSNIDIILILLMKIVPL